MMRLAPWRFAGSMPSMPHHYTLRARWGEDAAFAWAVECIRRHGYQRKFRGRAYTYLDANGHSYWTMGSPVPETTLINRASMEGGADGREVG